MCSRIGSKPTYMKNMINHRLLLYPVAFMVFQFYSCKKSDPTPAPTPVDPCSGKTITVTATPISTTGCGNDGKIQVSASGSTGFTFKLNASGTYQSTAVFNNITPGTYTVFAKDTDGCEKTASVTVSAGVKGPLFTQVRNLMTVKCQPCHNNTVQNGSMNWEVDCNIVANQARIKVRAVDEGTMPAGGPSLTTTEKAIITDWINGGGKLTD